MEKEQFKSLRIRLVSEDDPENIPEVSYIIDMPDTCDKFFARIHSMMQKIVKVRKLSSPENCGYCFKLGEYTVPLQSEPQDYSVVKSSKEELTVLYSDPNYDSEDDGDNPDGVWYEGGFMSLLANLLSPNSKEKES